MSCPDWTLCLQMPFPFWIAGLIAFCVITGIIFSCLTSIKEKE